MRLIILLAVATFCLAACGDEATCPPPDDVFLFDSGGAHHIQGYGAWHVKTHRSGAFVVTHQVRDVARDFDPATLTDEERSLLWAAIDAARIAEIVAEDRPGVPDESRCTFGLEHGENVVANLELWQNDLGKFPVLTPVLDQLRALIGKYCGEKPVF